MARIRGLGSFRPAGNASGSRRETLLEVFTAVVCSCRSAAPPCPRDGDVSMRGRNVFLRRKGYCLFATLRTLLASVEDGVCLCRLFRLSQEGGVLSLLASQCALRAPELSGP